MDRFTIQDYDFRDTIRIEKQLLLFTGFYPRRDKKFRPIQILANFFCVFVTYSQFVTMILYMMVHRKNLLKVTEALELFMTQLAFMTKLINFSINKQKLLALEDSLAHPRFYGYPQNCLKLFREKMRTCEFLVKVFRFFCIGCVVFVGSSPYMDNNTSKKRKLPLPGWFPYDVEKFYHLTTAFHISTIAISAYNNGTIDCLMWILTSVAASQFEVLKENLKNIHYSSEHPTDEDLIACIKHHKKIVGLAKSIEDMFSMGIFVQFFSSIIIICTTGFQITFTPIISGQFIYILFYFGCIMWQIGMYCWFGNVIMTTTDEISKCVYLSNWYESEARIRKILLIFLEKTKKPVMISAGKIVTLSLVTLLTIFRSSYSYFAVMQRLYRK